MVNANSIVQHVIQIKNVIMKHVNVSLKIIVRAKNYSWNPTTCIYENGMYLKRISNTSVIVCDEIMNSTDCVSRNVTNTIPTNVTNTV